MATGQEHKLEAERLLKQADEWLDADLGWRADLILEERIARRDSDLAAAQVHATLAQAPDEARTAQPRTYTDHDGSLYDLSRRYADRDGDVWELSGWLTPLQGQSVAVMACSSSGSQEKFSELAHVPFDRVLGEYGPLTELAPHAEHAA